MKTEIEKIIENKKSIDVDFITSIFSKTLKPREDIDFLNWCKKYRKLPSATTSQYGDWNFEKTPYLIEIMKALSQEDYSSEIYVMKGTQLGFTEVAISWLLYIIDVDASPTLCLLPNTSAYEQFSKLRFGKNLEIHDRIREKLFSYGSRREADTVALKEFPGGFLNFAAGSLSMSYREKAIRYFYIDELDKFPLDVQGEGDSVSLAKKRQATFIDYKLYAVSSPTVKDFSLIEKNAKKGDFRKYNAICIHCNYPQFLNFDNLIKKEGEVYYKCKKCKGKIYEENKKDFLKKGYWEATKKTKNTKIKSYHISQLYSNWVTWEDILEDFWKSKKNKNELKTFKNTVLAEVWEEQGYSLNSFDFVQLKDFVYNDDGVLPPGVKILTAGVDVQKDRVEIEIVGWGYGLESWSVEYNIIYGNTASTSSTVWTSLSNFLEKNFYTQEGNKLYIELTAIDSGYNTDFVHHFVQNQQAVVSVRGADKITRGNIYQRFGTGLHQYYKINTKELKDFIFTSIDTKNKTLHKSHFPYSRDNEYFLQLTAEELKNKTNKMGVVTGQEYQKIRERNEALDCRVYALACCFLLSLNTWTVDDFFNYAEKNDDEE